MFFGSLLRLCGFAIGAGLAFLLSPQEPALNWPHRDQLSIWQDARATVFKGLRRVKADLESARKDDRDRLSEAARANHPRPQSKLEFSVFR